MDTGESVPSDDELAELGSILGGDNPENDVRRSTDTMGAKERNGIENVTDYKAYEKGQDDRIKENE